VTGDLPAGAGLSSSAALTCGVVAALGSLAEADLSPDRIAALARRVETEYVRVPVGVMDHHAVMCATAGHAVFLDCRSLHVEQVPLDLTAGGMTLLAVDTRIEHRHAEGEYATRHRQCQDAARLLGVPALRDIPFAQLPQALEQLTDETLRRRVRHVVTENERVLATVGALRAGTVADVGSLLTSSHASLRDDFEVGWPQGELAVQIALDSGALGARLIGGGFGGSVLALLPLEQAVELTEALTEGFLARGYRPAGMFPVQAVRGATRLPDED
jgi:galactokinase